MIDQLIKAFETLIVEFTWRRFAVIAFLFVTGFAALVAFDWYTGFFSIGRLEKAEALMEKLVAVGPAVAASPDKGLQDVHNAIVAQLKVALASRQATFFSAVGLSKFGAGVALWLLFALALLPGAKRDPSNWNGVIGSLFIGVFFGSVGQFIPDSWARWPILVSFAIGNFLVTVVIILAWQARQNARKAKRAV